MELEFGWLRVLGFYCTLPPDILAYDDLVTPVVDTEGDLVGRRHPQTGPQHDAHICHLPLMESIRQLCLREWLSKVDDGVTEHTSTCCISTMA